MVEQVSELSGPPEFNFVTVCHKVCCHFAIWVVLLLICLTLSGPHNTESVGHHSLPRRLCFSFVTVGEVKSKTRTVQTEHSLQVALNLFGHSGVPVKKNCFRHCFSV